MAWAVLCPTGKWASPACGYTKCHTAAALQKTSSHAASLWNIGRQGALSRTVELSALRQIFNIAEGHKVVGHDFNLVAGASRGRSVHYEEDDTYVLIESGEDEVFVSEDELRERLKAQLEQWPKALPDDLNRFADLDAAVTHLIGSACELDLGPGQGNIQWFQVRLNM